MPDRTEVLQNLPVAELGEHALIRRITDRLVMPPWVLVGPGDDAAVVMPERGAFEVLTTDALVDGVHVDLRFTPPAAVGHRALAVNLSDLAAMGAQPRVALLSLVLPGGLTVEALDQMVDGMLALAGSHQIVLVGGNITRTSGPLVLSVTAVGSVRPRRLLRRSEARVGDEVFVTGRLGQAAVGLRQLRDDAPEARDSSSAADCVERYLRPMPRTRAGMLLGRNRAATSCVDLSDGLADGVRQLATASDVGMTLDAEALPIGDGVRQWHARHGGDPLDTALSGGDDYELLFTVRPRHRGRLRAVRRLVGDLPITRIGIVTRDRELVIRTSSEGPRALPEGYQHFRHGT